MQIFNKRTRPNSTVWFSQTFVKPFRPDQVLGSAIRPKYSMFLNFSSFLVWTSVLQVKLVAKYSCHYQWVDVRIVIAVSYFCGVNVNVTLMEVCDYSTGVAMHKGKWGSSKHCQRGATRWPSQLGSTRNDLQRWTWFVNLCIYLLCLYFRYWCNCAKRVFLNSMWHVADLFINCWLKRQITEPNHLPCVFRSVSSSPSVFRSVSQLRLISGYHTSHINLSLQQPGIYWFKAH